jgi:NADH:ubiquinone oxidoreductase subunit
MSHAPLKAIFELGPWGALKQLYRTRTLKFGRLVGVDAYGNKYYENTKDYPSGRRFRCCRFDASIYA